MPDEDVKCPECGAGHEDLDFFMGDDGMWYWNCFTCGNEWCSPGAGPTEVDEEDEDEAKEIEDEET